MAQFVLGAWLLQSAVGIALLAGWWRHGRQRAGVVLGHLALMVVALGGWIAFLANGSVGWAWTAFALVTVGNALGDTLLVARSRRTLGAGTSGRADYGAAIRAVFARRFPGRVTFHALFAGVVYFSALAACILGTLD